MLFVASSPKLLLHMPPSRSRRISWSSAAIGASAAAAATVVVLGRPKDPTFHLISITLSSFRLHLPLDLELILTVHVANPNLVPIHYSPSRVSISYDGSPLGSAVVRAGSQPPLSCRLLHLPARLDGLAMASHAKSILADAARREMELHASVDIAGTATLAFWEKRFEVHVDSRVVVDPIFLGVVDQDSTAETHLLL